MKLHEKYLKTERIDESNKNDDMKKLMLYIHNLRTEDQLKDAKKMVADFLKKYGDTFWSELTKDLKNQPWLGTLAKKFNTALVNKEDQLKFLLKHIDPAGYEKKYGGINY
jgi:hypothetical protein